jgi:hypothetical protein
VLLGVRICGAFPALAQHRVAALSTAFPWPCRVL